MKKPVVALLIMGLALAASWGASREEQWRTVEEAISQGLPQTALARLRPLLPEALAQKADVEAAKAMIWIADLEGQVAGNRPEVKIQRLQAARRQAPAEILPVLHTLLAHWYWQYAARNWTVLRRTAVGVSEPDLATWDVTRLNAELDQRFRQAVDNAAALKTIPISAYDSLLQKGTVPDSSRPTLYDFIACEALNFYTSGRGFDRKFDDYEVAGESDVLAPSGEFIHWKIEGPPDSPKVAALRLYQELLRFHQGDRDPTVYVAADIERLNFAKDIAYGDKTRTRYREAMKALAEKGAATEATSLAFYYWANDVKEEQNLVDARAIALRGAAMYPQRHGANNIDAIASGRSPAVLSPRLAG